MFPYAVHSHVISAAEVGEVKAFDKLTHVKGRRQPHSHKQVMRSNELVDMRRSDIERIEAVRQLFNYIWKYRLEVEPNKEESLACLAV